MDVFGPAKRSEVMRKVHGANTAPEIAVRSMAHQMGLRFSLRRKDLPGKPDVVFPSRKKVIFVHGCFWHGHNCRSGKNRPTSNTSYWIPKLDRNKERDASNRRKLSALGWQVLTIWECELRNTERLRRRLASFFGIELDCSSAGPVRLPTRA
jgi:DNA mismatch endonuclease (patch repair protein)